jgi:hypothetical protein
MIPQEMFMQFYDGASISSYIASDGKRLVNNELERIWKEEVMA